MSDFCPEWIFGICCGLTAKEFLSTENSLNSVARKYASGLSEKYNEIKFEEISECAEQILQFLSEIEASERLQIILIGTFIEEFVLKLMVPKKIIRRFLISFRLQK